MKISKKKIIKDLWIAFRPLSLSLSISSTTIGILLAYRKGLVTFNKGSQDALFIVLITFAGMAVLSCANLINDFYEGSFKYHRPHERTYKFLSYQRTLFDLLVFFTSLACLGFTGIVGLYLMLNANMNLFWIGLVGMIGSYAYTGEPFVYKKRGVGALFSLILVGNLMVLGSYMVFTQTFTLMPVLLAFPASLMIPLMMMSNEIRDYERDKKLGIKTSTVIFGIGYGYTVYKLILFFAYGLILILVYMNLLPLASLITLSTIPLAIKAYKTVAQEYTGIRITNMLHITFNALFILSLML